MIANASTKDAPPDDQNALNAYIQTVDAYGSLVDQSYSAFAVIPAHAGIQGLSLHKGKRQNPWIPDRVGEL